MHRRNAACNSYVYICKEQPYVPRVPLVLRTEQRRDSRPVSAHEDQRLDIRKPARKVSVLRGISKPSWCAGRRVPVSGVIKDNYTEEMRRGETEKEEKSAVLTYIGLVEFQ